MHRAQYLPGFAGWHLFVNDDSPLVWAKASAGIRCPPATGWHFPVTEGGPTYTIVSRSVALDSDVGVTAQEEHAAKRQRGEARREGQQFDRIKVAALPLCWLQPNNG